MKRTPTRPATSNILDRRSPSPGPAGPSATLPALPGGRHAGLMTRVPDRVDRRIGPGERVRRHKAASLIPRPRPAQYRALRESIRDQGVREPVVLSEGRLIDGRARLRACRELGIDCPAVEIGPVEDPRAVVLALNVQRRHLRAGQLAMLAARLCDRPRGGSAIAYADAMDQGRAAELLGISRSAIGLACRIARSGREELIEAVDAGTMALRRAIALLDGQVAPRRPGAAALQDHQAKAGLRSPTSPWPDIPPTSVPVSRAQPPSPRGAAVRDPGHVGGAEVPVAGSGSPSPATTPDLEAEWKSNLVHIADYLRNARRLDLGGEASDRDGSRVASMDVPVRLLGAAYEAWECRSQERFRRLRAVDPVMRGRVGRTSAIDRPDLERIGELADHLWRAFQSTVAQERNCPTLPHLLWAPGVVSLRQVCTDILGVLDAEAGPDSECEDEGIDLVEIECVDEEIELVEVDEGGEEAELIELGEGYDEFAPVEIVDLEECDEAFAEA